MQALCVRTALTQLSCNKKQQQQTLIA
jgi:hypothetical protein